MCILLNVKKHEKTFALNVDIFNANILINFILTKFKVYNILIITTVLINIVQLIHCNG